MLEIHIIKQKVQTVERFSHFLVDLVFVGSKHVPKHGRKDIVSCDLLEFNSILIMRPV